MGTLRWKKYLVELLPIPAVVPDDESRLKELLGQVMNRGHNEALRAIGEIDALVFDRIGLNEEEREFILAMNRRGSH